MYVARLYHTTLWTHVKLRSETLVSSYLHVLLTILELLQITIHNAPFLSFAKCNICLGHFKSIKQKKKVYHDCFRYAIVVNFFYWYYRMCGCKMTQLIIYILSVGTCILKIGFALSKWECDVWGRGGGRHSHKVPCTWWLSWLGVERPWLAKARPFFFSTNGYRTSTFVKEPWPLAEWLQLRLWTPRKVMEEPLELKLWLQTWPGQLPRSDYWTIDCGCQTIVVAR